MLALKIAWRYLRAKKSHNAVNVITIISVAGVAVATMAMVVVLSIFNGFTDLAASHLDLIDPPLKVERADLRVFSADSLSEAIRDIRGVRGTVPLLETRALLVGPETQTPVIVRGIPESYGDLSRIRDCIIEGDFALNVADADSSCATVVSVGVANKMLTSPDAVRRLRVYVPRRLGRINPANPAAAFRGTQVAVSGIFNIGQSEYDRNFILLPIDSVARLLEHEPGTADAIEVFTRKSADIASLKEQIQQIAGPEFTVKDTMEQHAESFRMISIEKWITFMMLVFILVIALFNIVSTLSLLVIEKRDNMRTLRALGAGPSLVRRVFILEGWLVTIVGGAVGIVLGVILTLLQQHFALVKLAGDVSRLVVDAYPVRLSPGDLLVTAAAVAVTGLLASQSTRLFLKKQ